MSWKVEKKDNTDSVLKELQEKQLSFVTQGGQMIKTEQQNRAPYRTGFLKSSHQSVPYVEEGVAMSETGPTAEYAEWVENGTFNMDAQPYAEPGFQAAKLKFPALAEKVMKL